MYAVVGCTECGAYWLLTDPGDSESATCPRCGRRHQTRKLRRFFESENREEARQARAHLIARKGGDEEALEAVGHVADLERALAEAGVSDEEVLEGAGLDPEEVAAAGEVGGGDSRSRDEVVRDALREQDAPTEDDVVAYATDHGVPAEAARDLLDSLREAGEVTESDGSLRLL